MKTVLSILIFTLLSSCTTSQKQTEKTSITATIKQDSVPSNANASHYTTKDTIFILTERNDTLVFSKKAYNSIIAKHPEFFEDYAVNPDQLYYNDNDREKFGAEAGQDKYYILYAHFLKKKNGIKTFAKQRQKLIAIYTAINSLFRDIQYGGTYFGHQYSRILGYAEYSVSILPKKESTGFEKTYDITKQKKLYIKSLRQLIADEVAIDMNIMGNKSEQTKRTKELNKIVDKLDSLITDIFYLRRAQAFHYEYYEYH